MPFLRGLPLCRSAVWTVEIDGKAALFIFGRRIVDKLGQKKTSKFCCHHRPFVDLFVVARCGGSRSFVPTGLPGSRHKCSLNM